MKRIVASIVAFAGLAASVAIACPATPADSQVASLSSSVEPPTRKVEGRVLRSPDMPALTLAFGQPYAYVGGQRFVLHGVAQVEQHFFVDADASGCIRRLYWVQFEGFLSDNTNSYRYKVNQTARIGGLEFVADATARSIAIGQGRADSDAGRAQAFLASKRHRMANSEILMQRLVHLVDDAKRNELMIIYMEDLGAMGLAAADLAPGGRAAARWDAISQDLLRRAADGLSISR